ncbi:uncharacterized protein V1513DRAFT_453259 [Lipomyces chichibuensis]|uniref:uncharacterized protein n=1 Tax=Lipomyces chichibuensis TaxID=1546026 RepID=UPI00334354EC
MPAVNGSSGDSAKISTSAVRFPVKLVPVPIKDVGVDAALKAQSDPSFEVKPRIFEEFALTGQVAIVTGGNGGLGLEFAIVLAELGAKVYSIDLPATPSSEFAAAVKYVKRLGSSLQYRPSDVSKQDIISATIGEIAAENDGKIHVCVAAAGILGIEADCTDYPAAMFEKVIDVNCNGVFFTAQAVAKQMKQQGIAGSIILIASMSASVTNREMNWIPYNASKSAVVQIARSMACELGPVGIRVNSLSPGHIRTKMTATLLDTQPEIEKFWASMNPLGRIGAVHELRGVIAWLASDASTFCTGSDILVNGGHTTW